jgi:hypothetical protein
LIKTKSQEISRHSFIISSNSLFELLSLPVIISLLIAPLVFLLLVDILEVSALVALLSQPRLDLLPGTSCLLRATGDLRDIRRTARLTKLVVKADLIYVLIVYICDALTHASLKIHCDVARFESVG